MKKNNNKGFSLVELIVVIAIMAVLVGVLAPSLLKYVEKSRVSKDAQNFDQVVEACNVAAANEKITLADGDLYSWATGTPTQNVTNSAFIADVADIIDYSKVTFTSTKWKGASPKITVSSGKIVVTGLPTGD